MGKVRPQKPLKKMKNTPKTARKRTETKREDDVRIIRDSRGANMPKRKKPKRKRTRAKKASTRREVPQKKDMTTKASDQKKLTDQGEMLTKITEKPHCGLCGKTKNLTQTECCGNWICDDEHRYVLFSFARNSCYRNHRRYTLCSHHYDEGHSGDWKTCPQCRDELETEMYVYYGTNEYNFEILENPPEYEPTKCSKCHRIIRLGEDGYSMQGGNYFCEQCTDYNW